MTTTTAEADKINPIEKKVLLAAVLFAAGSLALMTYAVRGLGVTVPTCLPNMAIFDHGSITKHGGKNYEIRFLAKMWGFEPSRVRVPVGSTLDVFVTSKDVTHGLQILGTNVNLMVVPSVVTSARVHFDHPGVFPVLCHEYCGTAHQNMNAVIEVSSAAEDISAEGLGGEAEGSPSEIGKKVADEKGCLACHSVDGSPGLAPTFKGIWGQRVQLTNGPDQVVNAEFIKEMILHASKHPVKGYEPAMPELALSDEEIGQIVNYLKDLK